MASVLSQTDLDGDGDADTATSGDTVTAFYSVRNTTARARTVTITMSLDAPGTTDDVTASEERTIRAGGRYREAVTY